jgi:hypothetical protein
MEMAEELTITIIRIALAIAEEVEGIKDCEYSG